MTYDQYWHGDVWIAGAFLEAYKLRQKQANENFWLQGLYFYDGVCRALQNAFRKKSDPASDYPKEPYEIFPEQKSREEIEAQEEAERLQAKLYMQQMMWAGKNWGKPN